MDNKEQGPEVFDNLLFPKIFQTFQMSMQQSKFIIAFLALTVISLCGLVMDLSRSVVTTSDRITELHVYVNDSAQVERFIEQNKESGGRSGVFSTLWPFLAKRFQGSVNSLFDLKFGQVAENIAGYFKALEWALQHHFLYCIAFLIIILAVMSVAGGAICRITALQFAQGEKPGLTQALRFSLKKFWVFFMAPLVPVCVMTILGAGIFLLGLAGRIPGGVGELVMGVFMWLALLAGVLIAFFMTGSVAGFNLMFPAIAYDGSDSLDSMERSFRYVYKKPWRMGFYSTIAAVYGAVCYTFVRLFAFLVLLGTNHFLQLGLSITGKGEGVSKLETMWPKPTFMNFNMAADIDPSGWLGGLGALLMRIALLVVVGLVVSFIISFYFSANTIIYSLMRKQVDNTSLEDVYTHHENIGAETFKSE